MPITRGAVMTNPRRAATVATAGREEGTGQSALCARTAVGRTEGCVAEHDGGGDAGLAKEVEPAGAVGGKAAAVVSIVSEYRRKEV